MTPVEREPTAFLYPFIEGDERDAPQLLVELAASASAKIGESARLRDATLAQLAGDLASAGDALARRFRRGGRLFTFGNGGSATDADRAAQLFLQPPYGRALPARSLVDDSAVLTALANDVGFELVFSRQLIAHAREGDIAMGFSTSGDSANVLRAFDEVAHRGVLTVGLAGYDGGSMASAPSVEHCFVVRSHSVHRIQECQGALVVSLWSAVQRALEEGGGP